MNKEKLVEKYKEQISDALLELKTKEKRYRQIPNILTFSRLASPLVIIPTAMSGNIKGTTALATFFCLTDLLDGFIARNWNLSSPLGADLDALTDKVFAGTLLLTGSIKKPYLLINTSLEGVIAGINLKEKLSGNTPSSTIMGKIKTGAVFTLGGLGVIYNGQNQLDKILPVVSSTTALLQTMTIASYIKKYNNNHGNKDLLEGLKEERNIIIEEIKNNTTKSSLKAPIQKIKIR